MVTLIRQFGQWLKQGFGWLIDVFVAVCAWGASQVERLLNSHLTIAPGTVDLVVVLVVILLFLVLAWLLRAVWYRIRVALGMVVDAVGWLFMALVSVATLFGGVGIICFMVLWLMGHTNIASLR